MTSQQTLSDLLSKIEKYHPHYGDRLAAHLPMALIALSKLNASSEQLKSYYQLNVDGLELVKPGDTANAIINISDKLGQSNAYSDYLYYYQQQIAQLGQRKVIEQALPHLLPGIAASAFHALIRLAYAIDADNDSEVAIALAYWSSEFQDFPIDVVTTSMSPTEILTKACQLTANHVFGSGIIVDHMAEVGALLSQKSQPFRPQQLNLRDIRLCCLQAFENNNDFTILPQ